MRPAPGKLLAIAAIAVVAFAVIAGALSVADPFTQRRIRFDERRVSDLIELRNLVGCYWRDRGQLPSDPDQFAAWFIERPSRTLYGGDYHCENEARPDPATDGPYGYRRLSDSRFELCAIFFEESHGVEPATAPPASVTASWLRLGFPTSTDWKHPAGEHCFRFEVRPPSEPAGDAVIVPLRES